MGILGGGQADFFGLDLSTTAVRVVHLKGSGPKKSLDQYGQSQLQGNTAQSEAEFDKQAVAKTIHDLVKQLGLTTNNVAVNVPSNRVFTTLVEWDKLPQAELAKTIRYQANSLIPTPLEQSKMDWAVVGDSPKDPNKYEILLSSVPNDYIEARLDMLESIGLNVVAFEPEGLAIARSMQAPDATEPQIILDIGSSATDVIVTYAGVPRLSRVLPIGMQTMVRSVSLSLNIDAAQAEQFIRSFGLAQDKMDGNVHKAIMPVIESLTGEIEKTIKYFQGRYPATNVKAIIVTGGASTLPELPLHIANKFGVNVEIGNPWRNVSYASARENELLSTSNHFAVAVGLAERTL